MGVIFVIVMAFSSFAHALYVYCISDNTASDISLRGWFGEYTHGMRYIGKNHYDMMYTCMKDSLFQIISLEGESLIRYYGKRMGDCMMIEMTLPVRKIGDRLYRVDWNGVSKDSLVRHAVYSYPIMREDGDEDRIKNLLPDFDNKIIRFDTLSIVLCRGIPRENSSIFNYDIRRFLGTKTPAASSFMESEFEKNFYTETWMPEEKYVFKDSPDRKITIQFSKPDLLFVKCDSGRFPFFEVYRVIGHIINGFRDPRFRGHVDVVEKLFSTRDTFSEQYVLPNEHLLFDITENNIFPDLTGYKINQATQSAWFDAFVIGPFLFILQNE